MDNFSEENAKGISLATEFLRQATEKAVNEAMEDSFESFLEDCVDGEVSPRNGYYERTVLTTVGALNVRVPRDRLSLFEDRILGRYRRRIDDFDAEVCRLYAQGMTCSDIVEFIKAETGSSISERLVLAIVKGSYGQAEKFNSRSLPACPIVYLDGTWLPVRRHYDGGDRYEKECVMIALGITGQGKKEVLGFWIMPSESSTRWGDCLRSIKSRGVGSPLLFVTDGLQGMPEAIKEVFPEAKQQRCLVHVGRNMSSGARKKDRQEILDGFAYVYSAPTEEEAKARLAAFVGKWGKTYPSFRKYLGMAELLTFYKFPSAIRKSIYTTNIIESFNRGLKRKLKARIGLHSLKNGNYVITVEAERYNRSKHNKTISGFCDLTPEELKMLGMER